MFAKEVADALWSALRELDAAPIAEDKATLAVGLCRQAAAILTLCSAKSPKLHASVRIRLASVHALAGDYDKALQVYAQDLDANQAFRSEAKRHLKELFDKQSLTPGGGRLDSPVTRAAQWKVGVYFLEHLTTETLSARRRAKGGNAETQGRGDAEKEALKSRAEILGIWGEMLLRTLMAVHGPGPVEAEAVAEFERVVTKRMEGEGGKGFAWKVKQNVQVAMYNEPSVVAMVTRVMEIADRLTRGEG